MKNLKLYITSLFIALLAGFAATSCSEETKVVAENFSVSIRYAEGHFLNQFNETVTMTGIEASKGSSALCSQTEAIKMFDDVVNNALKNTELCRLLEQGEWYDVDVVLINTNESKIIKTQRLHITPDGITKK